MRAERTIVLLKQFLGDGVMAEPLISALADNYSYVDVLALPTVQQVLGHLDGRVSFVHMEKLRTLRETMVQARKVRLKRYDVAYLVNRSFRSALLARLAKIPVRIGHGTEGRSFLLTKSVTYRHEDFEASSYADLAFAAGIEVTRVEPELRVGESERAAGEKLAAGATAAIQPGARHNYKRVPTEVLAAAARALQSKGHRIVLLGGPEEEPHRENLASQLESPAVNLVGKTSLRETMSVLSTLKVAVGGDTGVMHLAAGLGIPTVTAFGPTPAAKWGHHYAPHQVIQAPNHDIAQIEIGVLVSATLRAIGEA